MAPKTGSKKLVETWRPERDLDCTTWEAHQCLKLARCPRGSVDRASFLTTRTDCRWWFAGPRVSLKWWPAERQRAPAKKKTSVLEVGLLAGCMMFSSFLSAPVFLKLVLILSGVIFKPTVYHPLCGVFLVGLFSEDLRWCFLLSKRVLLMRLSFCRIFSRHVFNNSNCLALGWLLLDFYWRVHLLIVFVRQIGTENGWFS